MQKPEQNPLLPSAQTQQLKPRGEDAPILYRLCTADAVLAVTALPYGLSFPKGKALQAQHCWKRHSSCPAALGLFWPCFAFARLTLDVHLFSEPLLGCFLELINQTHPLDSLWLGFYFSTNSGRDGFPIRDSFPRYLGSPRFLFLF